MIEIKGKRASATVFADKIDRETKTKLAELLREEAYADSRIRIMPDTHSSKGTVVGTAMTLSGRVSPSLIGVDIGCGMEAVFLGSTDADLPELDRVIHENVPCGAKIHADPAGEFDFSRLYCRHAVDEARALRSVGTLGGGNHFIELDRLSDGSLLLVIHSGSRQLGNDVARYYEDQAYRYQCKKARRRTKGSRLGDEGYSTKADRRESRSAVSVKRGSAILEGELFDRYLHDIAIVQEFAALNRRTMAERICDAMGFSVSGQFTSVHNYIDTDHMILRKGAISARLGERVLIPLNMRDGVIIGRGLGNPDWNFSAPHGAGRACSRTDARYAYTVEEFRRQMEGIYTTTAAEGSLDECPPSGSSNSSETPWRWSRSQSPCTISNPAESTEL